MKCCQCPRLALYDIGDGKRSVPLCLACYAVAEDVNFRNWLKAAAMLNQASDELDARLPFGPPSGRIPVSDIARATSGSRTYNNINISNSKVGVLNTGNLARIDAAITMSQGTELEEFGARLKDLTDTIISASELNSQLRQEMVELAQAISDQAIGSKSPSKTVISTLFERLRQIASDATSIVGAVEKLHDAWNRLQGAI
jgi:hypothetical protein